MYILDRMIGPNWMTILTAVIKTIPKSIQDFES